MTPLARPAFGLVLCLLAFAAQAESARARALAEQAIAYEHGEGVARNHARAMQLYCEAARLGSAEAQFNLGWMYANGRGGRRDDGLAALFFSLAAAQGHIQARRMLAQVGEPVKHLPPCMHEPKPVVVAAPSVEPQPEEASWETVYGSLPPERKRIADLVHRLAPEFSVDPRLALAVITVESNFQAKARSPKNAQGLMQLIPETAARFNVRNPWDPVQNIRGGLAYLRWLLAYFRGDVALTVAAYNAGERAVDRYKGIPPYQETQAYVKRILGFFKQGRHPYDERVTAPSPVVERIKTARG